MRSTPFLLTLFMLVTAASPGFSQQDQALHTIHELFRLRNEHKADSAEKLFADTVRVYMKYMRNVPRHVITKSDKQFWKAHPKNKFEISLPVKTSRAGGVTTAIIYGREYLDGTDFKYEKIEIRLDSRGKIFYFRAYNISRLPT